MARMGSRELWGDPRLPMPEGASPKSDVLGDKVSAS